MIERVSDAGELTKRLLTAEMKLKTNGFELITDGIDEFIADHKIDGETIYSLQSRKTSTSRDDVHYMF